MPPGPVPYVGVVGPGRGASAGELADATEMGRLLGRAGAVLVCGGLGGVMAAACEGAAHAGGTTVGLLPGDDRSAANPHLTVALPTGLGELRNGLLVRSCDVVVAIGGSWGTLSEVALARRTGVPVVVLGGWQVVGDGAPEPLGVEARSPQDAVDRALELAGRR
jgi:uncharacterized protein (TIGR00725 family)